MEIIKSPTDPAQGTLAGRSLHYTETGSGVPLNEKFKALRATLFDGRRQLLTAQLMIIKSASWTSLQYRRFVHFLCATSRVDFGTSNTQHTDSFAIVLRHYNKNERTCLMTGRRLWTTLELYNTQKSSLHFFVTISVSLVTVAFELNIHGSSLTFFPSTGIKLGRSTSNCRLSAALLSQGIYCCSVNAYYQSGNTTWKWSGRKNRCTKYKMNCAVLDH